MITYSTEYDMEGAGEVQGMSLDQPTCEKIAKFFDGQHDKFVEQCNIVHRKSVFEGLIYLLRIINVDTGRLRGSFTPFMQKYGFSRWMDFIGAAPLGGGKASKNLSAKAIKEGQEKGAFVDMPMDTTIGTNVEYAAPLDAKVGFVARFLIWMDKRYNENFTNFLDAAAKNGVIPTEDANRAQGGKL